MDSFGTTRSRVRRSHALIAPESSVTGELPGWRGASGAIVISPRMGARFTQYLATMEPGGSARPPSTGVERVLYVLEGEATIGLPDLPERVMCPGGFAYWPPGASGTFRALTACRLNVFEKRFVPRPDLAPPGPICGDEREVEGAPFLGDSDAVLKVLLPADPRFDLAVNIFTYQPGATLPMVEVHVMEHGLLMLEGQGVYRLGDDWYPVRRGDVIWMAPYCPQWFVAMGKQPARYLYYKDINRDPMAEEPA